MRKLILLATTCIALAALPSGALGAPNPSETGTGPPSQSCVPIEEAGGRTPSVQATESPGSPFNEAEFNTAEGGTGGQHYNAEHSQYDVACYQVSQPH